MRLEICVRVYENLHNRELSRDPIKTLGNSTRENYNQNVCLQFNFTAAEASLQAVHNTFVRRDNYTSVEKCLRKMHTQRDVSRSIYKHGIYHTRT